MIARKRLPKTFLNPVYQFGGRAPESARAATDMKTFLQIDGVRGDVTAPPQYKGWIEVFVFDLNAITFTAEPTDSTPHTKKQADYIANLIIAEDASAPALQMAATGGMEFDSATIVMAEDNGAPKVKIKLTQVVIRRFQTNADGRKGSTAAVTLDYVRIDRHQGHVPATPKARFDPRQVHA